MKESNMWNILIYLFSNQLQKDGQFEQIMETLLTRIEDSGSDRSIVQEAIALLETLVKQNKFDCDAPHQQSFRVLDQEEVSIFDAQCQGLLLDLQQQDILTPYYRELVINKVCELTDHQADAGLIKWITLIILLQHQEEQRALACMELMALEDTEGGIQ